jgi:hypothetical protein
VDQAALDRAAGRVDLADLADLADLDQAGRVAGQEDQADRAAADRATKIGSDRWSPGFSRNLGTTA